ncbi:MAG: CHAT domain-containing protein [Potamolinea sp.]
MSKKLTALWYRLRHLLMSAPLKLYQQRLGLIVVALLALFTTLSLPALSAKPLPNPLLTKAPVTKEREPISRVDQQVLNPVNLSNTPTQPSNAQLLLQQGIELYEAQRFSEATEVWQQGNKAFVTQGDPLNQALLLRYLSLAYQHLGQWTEAQRSLSQSLKLLDIHKDQANTPAYLDVFAKALNTQGRLHWSQGQWSKAIATWKKAAATYEKAGNKTGVIGSVINQAEALQALGLSNQAQAELLQVQQILQQQSDPAIKVTGLENLGKALRRVGKLKESQKVLQTSLQIAQEFKLSQALGSILLELGNTERALGNTSLAMGNLEDEKTHTQTAIAFYQQATDSAKLRLLAGLNLLSLLVETGKWSEAANLGSTIQPAVANLPPSRTSIYAQLHLAHSLTCLQPNLDTKSLSCISGDRQEKLRENLAKPSLTTISSQEIAQILATAIQQARSLKDRTAESYALGQLGGLYEATQQWSVAQDLTQQALLIAQEIQSPDIRYQWEWQLGRLLEKQGDRKKAIIAYQEAVETLKSIRGDLLTINSEVQFSFRDNVEPIHRKLVDLLLKTDGNTQPSQENLKRAIEVIDSLQLAELENFLSCKLSQKVQLNQDIEQVDQKAALIYPILLEDRLEVIVKIPGKPLKHYVTALKRHEVEKTAVELRANILKRNRPEEVIVQATQIYKWLIEPLEQDLENSGKIKTLVFMLDGALRNIPMSVLYDGKRQEYLMQKPYAIAVVPGLQLFDLRPFGRKKLKILTAGVSEQREIEGRKFDKLPNVVEELQQIGNIVPSESLLNPKFTQANLQQQINSGSFIAVHLATHGQFSSDPEETFILAYNQLLKSNELNNLLRVNNQSRESRVELLVLSACETAKGDNRATLGLAGIAVRAGARSTLSTLWQVSDRSTSELMERFYKELTKPEVTKAEALHQAQLELFKKYKSPYYWAAYVLVGNWL